jgi:hypothetical protein
MKAFRFTLRGLFGVVTLLALALAAVSKPTLFWTSAVGSLTFALLAIAIIAAALTRGPRRAFWVGFAVFGWMHLILATTPWFAARTSSLLLTRYCLEQLAAPLGHGLDARMYIEDNVFKGALAEYVPGSPPDRYYKYIVIGQCLFTLLFGLAGGMLGRYSHSKENLYDRTDSANNA